MNETTQNYGLEIIDKKTEVVSPDKINRNMVKLDAELNKVQTKVEGIDVTTDVENVVNRRVNADTSKPLSTLISEWITSAKTAILNDISTLTSHVTSQHTATKNHVTTKVDGLPQKSVWTDGRGAKLDNLDQKVSTAENNIKTHVTNSMNSPKVVKSVQRGRIANDSATSRNIAISAVNMSKSLVIVDKGAVRDDHSGVYYFCVTGRLTSSTVLQITGYSVSATEIDWQVIEFY